MDPYWKYVLVSYQYGIIHNEAPQGAMCKHDIRKLYNQNIDNLHFISKCQN